MHFQRTFSRNILEATAAAAAQGISPAPSLLRTFAALERATGDASKPATRLLLGMKGKNVERWLEPVPSPRDRRRALAERARDGNLPADPSA